MWSILVAYHVLVLIFVEDLMDVWHVNEKMKMKMKMSLYKKPLQCIHLYTVTMCRCVPEQRGNQHHMESDRHPASGSKSQTVIRNAVGRLDGHVGIESISKVRRMRT